MSKKDVLLAIDYVKSSGSGGTSRVVGSGSGGTVDTSGFLLLDGSRSMTGNFSVGGNNIINVNLVDGVDLAAHVANANAHHNRQHSYDSTSDHTGLLSWSNLNKTGSDLADLETRSHTDLQDITENDHHNRQHNVTSGFDHTITGSAFDVVGATATNTIGLLTPSSNVSSGIERILKSTSTGNLNLASLTTSLINSTAGSNLQLAPNNYLTLSPANYLVRLTSSVSLQSDNYASQTTGMRISHAGEGDFRYLYATELHAKSFIADLEQALAGGQIITKSVAVLAEDFTLPSGSTSYTAPTFVAVAQNAATTTSLVVDKPTGTVDDDDMIAIVTWWTYTLTPPAGWTEVTPRRSWSDGGDVVYATIYKKTAASEGANYTWGLSTAYDISVAIVTTRGGGSASIIDTYASQNNTGTTSVTAPAITTTYDNTLLLFMAALSSNSSGTATVTPPSGMTERSDATDAGVWAKSYVATSTQTTAGSTGSKSGSASISVNSAGWLIGITPTASGGSTSGTIVLEDLPSAPGMAVFESGDIIRLRQFDRSAGSLTIADAWGTVTSYVDNTDGTQNWTFTRSSSPNAGTIAEGATIPAKSIILDYGTTGNGFNETNAIDGLYGQNSPYVQSVVWSSHPATGQTVVSRLGNLRGIFGAGNEYGLYAGTGTTDASSYLRISNTQLGLYNVPLRMFTGSTETVHIGSWNDVWLGPNSSNKLLSFNGSTLAISAVVTISSGSSGYGNLSGIPTSLSDVNATEGSKLTGIASGATKNTVYRQSTTPAINNGDLWYNTTTKVWYQCVSGAWQIAGNYVTNTNELTDGANLGKNADWGSSTLNGLPTRFSFETTPTEQSAQLFLAANAMGYWDGTNWRTYFDNSGQMVLRGGSGAYVVWDGTQMWGGTSSTFNTSTANWYVSSTTGAFVAGQGQVYISKDAVNLTWDGTYNSGGGDVTYGAYSKFKWYLTASTSSTLLGTMSLGVNPLFAYASSYSPTLRETALKLISNSTTFTGLYLQNSTGSVTISLDSSGISHLNGTTATGTLIMNAANIGTSTGTISGSVRATNWFRSIGTTGWYSETYGGGVYMVDTTWVRVYNSKSFLVSGTTATTTLYVGATTGSYAFDVTGEARVTGSVRTDTAISIAEHSEPATSATYGVIYIDTADGDLKVKFKNGVKRTLAVN